jgi:hypothetical protein
MVHCTFDFHLFGSDRLGFGPYGGSSFDLTVLDGEIVRAGASFEVEEFSPQMWEPFEAWVSEGLRRRVGDVRRQGPPVRLSEELLTWGQSRVRGDACVIREADRDALSKSIRSGAHSPLCGVKQGTR